MNDLITLLDFIAKGNGTIISSGQAKGLLNHITHIEQERDQLKVENNSLRKAAKYAIPYLRKGHLRDSLENAVDTTKQQHLAEHDAQVIEREIDWLHQNYPHLDGPHLGLLQSRVNQLRQKAQEA